MSQEKRPQVYPLLPQNDDPLQRFENEPIQGGPQVIALQPVNENIPKPGSHKISVRLGRKHNLII